MTASPAERLMEGENQESSGEPLILHMEREAPPCKAGQVSIRSWENEKGINLHFS